MEDEGRGVILLHHKTLYICLLWTYIFNKKKQAESNIYTYFSPVFENLYLPAS